MGFYSSDGLYDIAVRDYFSWCYGVHRGQGSEEDSFQWNEANHFPRLRSRRVIQQSDELRGYPKVGVWGRLYERADHRR